MLGTDDGPRNIFRVVEQIKFLKIQKQAHIYFRLLGIGNMGIVALPISLSVFPQTHLSDNHAASTMEIQNFYDRIRSDMISKGIEGSITKTYLKKLRFHCGEYEWAEAGGIISNYVPTMLYLIFKSINPAIRIGVLNLKDEI